MCIENVIYCSGVGIWSELGVGITTSFRTQFLWQNFIFLWIDNQNWRHLPPYSLFPMPMYWVLILISSVKHTVILFVSVELNSDGKIYQPYLKINYEVVDDSADVRIMWSNLLCKMWLWFLLTGILWCIVFTRSAVIWSWHGCKLIL